MAWSGKLVGRKRPRACWSAARSPATAPPSSQPAATSPSHQAAAWSPPAACERRHSGRRRDRAGGRGADRCGGGTIGTPGQRQYHAGSPADDQQHGGGHLGHEPDRQHAGRGRQRRTEHRGRGSRRGGHAQRGTRRGQRRQPARPGGPKPGVTSGGDQYLSELDDLSSLNLNASFRQYPAHSRRPDSGRRLERRYRGQPTRALGRQRRNRWTGRCKRSS